MPLSFIPFDEKQGALHVTRYSKYHIAERDHAGPAPRGVVRGSELKEERKLEAIHINEKPTP